ncbi:MAG: hypothetical protein JST22_02575 [Bacteroidetes bacterium]|nr:hypothetical protein [Bacteroidota bacterium]
MATPKCFICSQQVVGLNGQDTVLDTFFLHSTRDDKLALSEQAFGECHLLCLTESAWGVFWGSRIVANLRDVRKYRVLFADDEYQMLRNDIAHETSIIRWDGWMASVQDRLFEERRPVADGHLLPVHHEARTYLNGHDDLITGLRGALLADGTYPLKQLIAALGLTDRLLYPQAIEGGTLRRCTYSSAPKNPIAIDDNGTFVMAEISYSQFIPDDVARMLIEHVGKSP